MADSGLISYAELVDLIAQLDDSKSYMVAEAVQQVVSGLKRFIDEGSLAEKSFNRLVITIYQEDFNQHGFEKKLTNQMKMRWYVRLPWAACG